MVCHAFPCSVCPSRRILGFFKTVFSLASGFINKDLNQFAALVFVGFFGWFVCFVRVFWWGV